MPPIGGLYATYHLLREPGNSIDNRVIFHQIMIMRGRVYKLFSVVPETRGEVVTMSPVDEQCFFPSGNSPLVVSLFATNADLA